ncbi:hypothetical protein GGI20_003263 [Coemansia sp. BCRC 34301]|nr:hypothetical protein GGI20_003263 [Coemansia sp. BCRC 34301]
MTMVGGGGPACCSQSKLGGNGSSGIGGQQNQRPVAPVPPSPLPAATRSSPYTVSGSSVVDGSEIKPLSNSQARLRRHELAASAATLAAYARDGRRKVSRKLPAAKPMSDLLYRGHTSLSPPPPPNVPTASTFGHQDDAMLDYPPTAIGTGLEAGEELLDRMSLGDCVAATNHCAEKPSTRRSWLLTTRSVAPATLPLRPATLGSPDIREMRDVHLPAASALYRKRALALRRASGCPAKTLVAPEELTVSAILPEEPNGVTSMIAISMVLIFATFVAF